MEYRIDYKDPDYTEVFRIRQLELEKMRSRPQLLGAMKIHYRHNPWQFIGDWGMTFEPRNVEIGRLPDIPFILWPRQEEFLRWLMDRWMGREDGLVEKSRDFGLTWLCVGFAATQWLFSPGFSAGFGSRKKELVDRIGDPDSIFEKLRYFVYTLPKDFLPKGFNPRLHDGSLKLLNPENNASITGEAGDDIGRGGRKAIFFVDEAAFIEHQQKVDSALSNTTNCKIDISTYNGTGNPFYVKAQKFDRTRYKFICDWHDDPRKDQGWYDKQVATRDPVIVAQEIDRDPNASAENVFIPSAWVNAAVDLHLLIKVPPTGLRVTSFDPADVGDARAVVNRHGYVVLQAELLEEGDITEAIPWAYNHAFGFRADVLVYDADGMGAAAMKLTFDAHAAGRQRILPYYGSGEVRDKDRKYGGDGEFDATLRTNGDTFLNFRAQSSTALRDRFEAAYNIRKQVNEGGVALNVDVEKIISLSSECTNLIELKAELSRPARQWTNNGKIKVESKIDMRKRGVQSPNLFDACVMSTSVRIVRPSEARRNVRVRERTARDAGVGM